MSSIKESVYMLHGMRRRHLPVMALHSIPTDVVVNCTLVSVRTRVRQNSTGTPDTILDVNP